MKNVCKAHHCTSCCYGTEMPLLRADVQRLVLLGFKEEFFTVESDGFKILKNSSHGRCVFHDGKQCTIYPDRPNGCKLYPVIFDEDQNHPVKDELCPFRNEFGLSPRTGQELTDVYTKLIEERQDRNKDDRRKRHMQKASPVQ
ncbi:MAG: YkgJ family cysteine cluster protein [Nitrososphaerales archaeon]